VIGCVLIRYYRPALTALVALVVTSACGANMASQSIDMVTQGARAGLTRPVDTTSVLKKLRKNVVIGSTVDSGNGDKGPRAISIVTVEKVLGEGDLLVCNFENSAGSAGSGTTIEILKAAPGSLPTRFVQDGAIEGCDADAIDDDNTVFAGGLTSGELVKLSDTAKTLETYQGSPIKAPFYDAYAVPQQPFSPQYIFIGTTAGGIVSISTGPYGDGIATQVADGFAVNMGTGWSLLAPSGLQYDAEIDTLYIADGVTNTIVAFSHASELLEQDEITVKPSGKTFKCKQPKVTCARLVYSGAPLDGPLASALLPDGNLIVANTRGTANTLVELTPAGQILDTKVIDKSATQGVFGLAAIGTDDANTALYFTDANDNNVHKLER